MSSRDTQLTFNDSPFNSLSTEQMTHFSRSARTQAALAMLFSRLPYFDFASRCRLAVQLAVCVAGSLLLLPTAEANQFVKLDYNLTAGDRGRDTVFFELFDDKPITTSNFMSYTNAGKYDGMFMHRLSHGFVMQGGGFYPQYQSEPTIVAPDVPWSLKTTPDVLVDLDGNPATANPVIPSEYLVGTERSNIRGTVAMARGALADSASSQWFVSYANNSFLDDANGGNGFTVFAEVRGDGMAYYDELDVLATAQAPEKTNILNLNQDANNDGFRDQGPYFIGNNDAVPVRGSNLDNLVIVEKATRIDYYGGTGSSTALNIPAGGYTISTRDAFFDTGANITGTGALTIGAGRTLGVRSGISLNRQVNNSGTLAPGLRNAQLTVQAFQQTATGKLEIQLRGTTVDAEYDRLAVTGNAQLGGELEVRLLDGFAPSAGQVFTVLTAASISNTFSVRDLPSLNNGLVWSLSQSPTAYALRVIRADYNENGVVDAGDYTIWRDNLNRTVTAFTGADGDGNGVVNQADFTLWRSNFGKTSAAASSGSGALTGYAVPEPTSAAILLSAAWIMALASRRRK
jgi:cyclophilin family peptidyl-prolyl cis-trans isomerase